jgi:hypothetical protein
MLPAFGPDRVRLVDDAENDCPEKNKDETDGDQFEFANHAPSFFVGDIKSA